MNALLVTTWQLLRRYPLLLVPVALETLLMLLFTGGHSVLGSNAPASLALFLLHQALLAGLLYQIKIILSQRSTPPVWDDFFEGVGRYFWALLSGASMFFLVLMANLSICSLIAESQFGPLDTRFLEKMMPLLQKGDSVALETLLKQNSATVSQLWQWGAVLLVGLALMGLLLALTSFWQSYCVLADQPWLKSWKASYKLIVRYPGKIFYLGLIWLFPNLCLQFFLLNPRPLFLFVGLCLDILAKTYLTLLFAHTVQALDTPQMTPISLQKAEV